MTMVTAALRPTTVLVSEHAIEQNIHQALASAPKTTALFAVVKADAYGHGLVRVARVAVAAGATGFCVAVLEEALALREAGFTQPILVLGIIAPEYAFLAAANNVALPVGDVDWLEQAAAVLPPDAPPVHLHVAIDSGMGRIGFREAEAITQAAALVAQNPQMVIDGVFTHFATADEVDTTYFDAQVAHFKALVAALPERPRYVHVANSATSLWHQACDADMIRLGVAMYGLNPSGGALTSPYPLAPALSLVSALVFTKQLHQGDAVSYGATYRAQGDEWIGTVPMGYADGWLRRMQGFHVLVDGQFCEIVGRVCMDQFMIRMPQAYPPGTPVVLVGESQGATITMQDVADYAGTIHYEIICGLAARLPRRSVATDG